MTPCPCQFPGDLHVARLLAPILHNTIATRAGDVAEKLGLCGACLHHDALIELVAQYVVRERIDVRELVERVEGLIEDRRGDGVQQRN